jgi:hypothetical protein
MPEAGWKMPFARWHLPVILIAAFFLRLAYLEWAEAYALGSQVNDSVEAYEFAVNYLAGDERAQYLAQPNCNIHSKLPGPAWTLYCAAGLKIANSMRGIGLITIMANLLAIALTWYLARKLFDPASATIAALWMAVSPWAVFYSSIIFNPSLMPLFGALIFLAMARCLAHERSRAVFFLPFLILLGLQFHMSPLTLILPLAGLAWLRRMKPAWTWLCAGIIAGVLCYVPYLYGDAHHQWENTHGMLMGGRGGFSATALRVFSSPFSFLINYWSPNYTYTPDEYRALARATFGGMAGMSLINIVSVLCCALIVIAVYQLTSTALRGIRTAPRATFSQSPGILFAAFLVGAFLLMNLLGGKAFHARYCLLILPLIFALVGAGTTRLLENPRHRKIFLPLLTITILANLWFMPRLSWFEHRRIEDGPRFVPGIQKLEALYRHVQSHAGLANEVEIESEKYTESLSPEDPLFLNTIMIRRYIHARTIEMTTSGTHFTGKKSYEMRAAAG